MIYSNIRSVIVLTKTPRNMLITIQQRSTHTANISSNINVNLKMYSFDHLRMYNIDHINTCCSRW